MAFSHQGSGHFNQLVEGHLIPSVSGKMLISVDLASTLGVNIIYYSTTTNVTIWLIILAKAARPVKNAKRDKRAHTLLQPRQLREVLRVASGRS